MLPNFLLPETVTRENGSGSDLEISPTTSKQILLTLGITRILEQESLDIEIWGSSDKADWGSKPLLRYPQKFYCGTYSLLLDLSKAPQVKYLRVNYKVNRWGRGDSSPLFGFYVFAQEAAAGGSVHAAVA